MSFPKVAEVKAAADSDVIDLLDSLLVDARAGQVRGLVVISVDQNGEPTHSYAVTPRDFRATVSELEIFKMFLVNRFLSQEST